MNSKTTYETRLGLNNRTSTLNDEMRGLLSKRDSLALDVAEGNSAASQTLSEVYRGIDQITRERDAIAGALRQLDSRQSHKQLQARLAKVETDRDAAIVAFESVPQAFADFTSAVDGMKAAWTVLQSCELAASEMEYRTTSIPNGHALFSPSLSVVALAEGLIWAAVGQDLVPKRTVGAETNQEARDQVESAVRKGIGRVREAARRKAADVQSGSPLQNTLESVT